jgi:hypothetical protein
MTAKKQTPGAVRGKDDDRPGQDGTDYLRDTTACHLRQLVKIALPYISAIVTSTRYTDRKSRFLDRLLVLAEGGRHD